MQKIILLLGTIEVSKYISHYIPLKSLRSHLHFIKFVALSTIIVLSMLFNIDSNHRGEYRLQIMANALALPIDCQGNFGVSTGIINHSRRTDGNVTVNPPGDGSQDIPESPGNYANASYQSYVLKLAPSIIINDGASFFGEVTTGYNYGGFAGDNSLQKKIGTGRSFGESLYYHNTGNGNPNLVLSQFHLNVFADTATYIVGRQSFHWGLGALFNEGSDVWDRYKTIQDGITIKFKVGNFNLTPYWGKHNSTASLTAADDSKSYGVTLLYDSIERDVAFGIVYGKKTTATYSSFYTSGDGHNIGRSDVKITDIFFKKTVGNLSFQLEAPILSGDLGNLYTAGNSTPYKSYAIITETAYKFNESWSLGLMLGLVSGDDGGGSKFKAMYLNPDYQIANLLFRYNLYSVSDSGQSLYDSYISNTKYLKLHGQYQTGAWNFNAALILAKAQETAKGHGSYAFNHSISKRFISNFSQNNSYGTELDADIKYQWNSNVAIHSSFGYLFVGDYYKFTNLSDEVKLHNSYSALLGVSTTF
ncbi:MAG: hypothetical protein HQK53_04145 [Oligoflexia bacterium]|nr:hypothetical protein [Oligoflexia bacterium]